MEELPKDLKDLSAENIVKLGEELGKRFAREKKITTSQIRNVFSDIKRIHFEWKARENKDKLLGELTLLKPKLAYTAGRHSNVRELKKVLEKAIDGVVNSQNSEKAGENFFNLVEAIVAYHKYYGGK